jgi:lysozyme
MELSDTGANLIKKFEGLRLSAYRDSAGVWTIGYGSTRYADGASVKPGDHLTNKDQADQLFRNTLVQYTDAVKTLVKVPLSQNQVDALVSFTYNEGTGALRQSTLLKKLNQKDFKGAADQFLVWNKITDPHTGKKVICDALRKRREQERQLFLTGIQKSTS